MADDALLTELRAALKRTDDYASAGKPACEWDDKAAREALVDALARDAYALLGELHDRQLASEVTEAAKRVATVVGQDLEEGSDGRFRIAHRVAPDRVISTVDPEAPHGHKTSARGFDGYKGHIAIDPDSEIITSTAVTAANVSDGRATKDLLADVITDAVSPLETSEPASVTPSDPEEVYGDARYGTGKILEHLEGHAIPHLKVQPPSAPAGYFSKEAFEIDLDRDTVKCPAGELVQIRRLNSGALAEFAPHCSTCPLREQCTKSKSGRVIRLNEHERLLQRERKRQKDPAWKARYKATRPKIERKHAHRMRRRHGGRRARMRGRTRIAHDFALLAAATNLQRFAMLRPRKD